MLITGEFDDANTVINLNKLFDWFLPHLSNSGEEVEKWQKDYSDLQNRNIELRKEIENLKINVPGIVEMNTNLIDENLELKSQLSELRSSKEGGEWIETESRKPEFNKQVLVHCKIYGTFIASYDRIRMNYMNEIIEQLTVKIQAEKERLIKLRISERVGEDVDLIKEASRMFPRISRKFNTPDQSEHWYWNDGTENGKHLITFYQDITEDLMSKDYKINAGFKYL